MPERPYMPDARSPPTPCFQKAPLRRRPPDTMRQVAFGSPGRPAGPTFCSGPEDRDRDATRRDLGAEGARKEALMRP